MKVIQYKKNNEYYTTAEDIQYFINIAKIPKSKIIWCPFDKKNSNFVRVFQKNGYKVEFSHIEENQDFYNYEPEHWDIIVSNPPFSNKQKLITRLQEFNKPFALIFGNMCFNCLTFIEKLTFFKNIEFCYLKRRVCFYQDYENGYNLKELKRPSFNSLWICNAIFGYHFLVFEGVNYKKLINIWENNPTLKEKIKI